MKLSKYHYYVLMIKDLFKMMRFMRVLIFIKILLQVVKKLKKIVIKKILIIEKDCDNEKSL